MELTLSEFARHCGVSRQAVYKAADPPGSPGDGLFPCYQTKRGRCVNTDETRTREYYENIRSRKAEDGQGSGAEKPAKPKPRRPRAGAKGKKKAKKAPAVGVADDKPKKPDDVPDYLKAIVDSGDLTFDHARNLSKTELEKIKIYEDIRTKQQNREEKRRSLVSRTLIKAVFGHIYEIHTTQFLTLKTKIIPDLLSIMSEKRTITADMVGKSVEVFIGNRPETITAADKIIDGESYKVLEAIKREIKKALKIMRETLDE